MIIMYARIVKILTVVHGNPVAKMVGLLTLCVELQEMIAIDGSLILHVMVDLLPSVVSTKEVGADLLYGIT